MIRTEFSAAGESLLSRIGENLLKVSIAGVFFIGGAVAGCSAHYLGADIQTTKMVGALGGIASSGAYILAFDHLAKGVDTPEANEQRVQIVRPDVYDDLRRASTRVIRREQAAESASRLAEPVRVLSLPQPVRTSKEARIAARHIRNATRVGFNAPRP